MCTSGSPTHCSLLIASKTDRYAALPKVRLHLGNGELAIVEHGGGQGSVRLAGRQAVVEVLQRPDAAGRDHRDAHGLGDGPRQLQVVSFFRSVLVHAGEQDFARPQLLSFNGPRHRVLAGRRPSPVHVHLPFCLWTLAF